MACIPFSRPTLLGCEAEQVVAVLQAGELSGGRAAAACERLLNIECGVSAALLTCSASAALEMSALLLALRPGDEVILPSFQFPSAANAILRCGAVPVFVDIDPRTMNIDPQAAAAAVTPRTRALSIMHYGGVACDMQPLLALCAERGLDLLEDAAQALGASWRGKPLGSFGRAACLSFHATKNLTMGEGGALLLREAADLPLAEQLRDKGTDQAAFRRGEKTFYQWQRQGISAVPSGLAAACLLPQLEQLAAITAARRALWQRYDAALAPLYAAGLLGGPYVPPDAFHNAHIYFIKTADAAERSELAAYLAARGIGSASHFQPLHSAPAGRRYGRFHGEDRYTTRESERLLRLPLYHGMPPQAVEQTAAAISAFYGRKGV